MVIVNKNYKIVFWVIVLARNWYNSVENNSVEKLAWLRAQESLGCQTLFVQFASNSK
jgi:hypothetical protein